MSTSSSSDESEYVDVDVSERKMSQHRPRAKAISAEADNPTPTDFEPPVHLKSIDETNRLKGILEKNVLFSSIEPSDIGRLVSAFEKVQVKKGEVLIHQYEEGTCLYVVEAGVLKVYKKTSSEAQKDSKEEDSSPFGPLVNTMEPGNSVGELALLYTAPRAATVIADTDSIVHKLDRETFNFIVKGSAIRKREKLHEILKSIALLEKCDPQQLIQLADAASTARVEAKTFIMREGDRGDAFYILYEGAAEAFKGDKKVYKYSSGDYFGELALLNNAPRAATVITTEPSTLIKFDVAAFNRLVEPLRDMIKEHPATYTDQEII